MKFFQWLLDWLFPATEPDPPADPPPTPAPSELVELWESHNAARHDRGQAPLELDSKLNTLAQEHADWMASAARMNHSGFSDRLRKYGPTSGGVENVAAGQETVRSVMSSWRTSPGHWRNIQGNWDRMGAGIAVSTRGLKYWCVIFVRD